VRSTRLASSPLAVLALLGCGLVTAGCHDFAALSKSFGASGADLGDVDMRSSTGGRDLSALGDGGDGGDGGMPVADLATLDLASVPGHLSGSGAATLAMIDLTTEGTLDWAHYGYPTSGDMDNKANVTSQISYYKTLSGNTATVFANNPSSFAWEDGVLTATVSGTTTGMYRTSVADGFRITVPASTQPRTLQVYVGGYRSNGKLTASLSDQSAPDYSDASFSRSDGSLYSVTYTLTFNAARDGERLTVSWAAASVVMDGNVSLEAAALK
jgi:hypothetical protein